MASMIATSASAQYPLADPNFATALVSDWSSSPGASGVNGTFDVADIVGPAISDQMPPDGWPDVVIITWRSLTVLRNTREWRHDPNLPGWPVRNNLTFVRRLHTYDIHHNDVKLADMDGDTYRDIVTTAMNGAGADAKVRIYLNNVDGTWGTWDPNDPNGPCPDPNNPCPDAEFAMTSNPNDPNQTMSQVYGLALTDVNNDGVREILVAGSYKDGYRPAVGVAFRPAGGRGSGQPDVDIYAEPEMLARGLHIYTGPLKNPNGSPGNSLPDFAASLHWANYTDGLGIGRNTGSGGAFTPSNPFTDDFGVAAHGMTGARFRNSLAYHDLVEVGYDSSLSSPTIVALKNLGNGQFQNPDTPIYLNPEQPDPNNPTEPIWATGAEEITSGLLNADGYYDVAVAASLIDGAVQYGRVLVFRGDGTLAFYHEEDNPPYIISADDVPTFIKAYDMNLDCRQDLLTLALTALEIRVYLNRMPVSCD